MLKLRVMIPRNTLTYYLRRIRKDLCLWKVITDRITDSTTHNISSKTVLEDPSKPFMSDKIVGQALGIPMI